MKRFFRYLRNRGFTLVEALVVTIIAGYCILPVIGTMHSGMLQTERFDHNEKLRTLARSRLNKELSAGAFDHTSIDTSDNYHYIYYDDNDPPNILTTDATATPEVFTPYSGFASGSILFTYQVSVAVKDNLQLATTTHNIDTKLLHGLPGLKAISVQADYFDGPEIRPEYASSVASLSYFAMLNIPSFSDDYIWIANARNVEIIAVDPESKTAVNNFLLPLANVTKKRDDSSNDLVRPWNLAVHPSKKFLVYQRKNSIAALNIDNNDTINYGKIATQSIPWIIVEGTKDQKDFATEDLGIVFRPDGKCLFLTSHSQNNLSVIEIPANGNWNIFATNNFPGDKSKEETLSFGSPTIIATMTTNRFSSLHAGNDGYLYLGLKDQKKVVRFPMFPKSFADIAGVAGEEINDGVTTHSLISVQTSPDGQTIYTLKSKDDDPAYLAQHSSKTLAKTGAWRFAIEGKNASDMKISRDGRYIGVVDEYEAKGKGINKGGLYVADMTVASLTPEATFSTFSNTMTVFKAARQSFGASVKNRDRNDTVLFDHFTNEFFFDDREKPLLFGVDPAGVRAGTYENSIPDNRIVSFASANKSMVAMTSRVPQHIYVATGDGTTNTVETIDVYTGRVLENKSISLPATPVAMALSPLGEKFKVVYGNNRTDADTFDTIKAEKIASDTNPAYEGLANMFGVAIPNEGYLPVNNATQTYFATIEKHSSDINLNGYWFPQAPVPAGLPSNRCRDANLDTDWEQQKMIPLHRGGFLFLFKKSDGSTMLDWIGRHEWGANQGKYERFARWYSYNGFPPQKATDIAISPDDRMLALRITSSPDEVWLYDFSGSLFGHETQLTGWVVDYRDTATPPWRFELPATGCSFTVTNPDLASGIKLKDSITSRDNWTSYLNFPGNFHVPHGTSISGANLGSKRNANRRFFGYYVPETNIGRIGMHNWDHTRWFFNHSFIAQRTDTSGCGDLPDPLDVHLPAFSTGHIQIDYNTNGGNVNQGIFTHPTAGNPLGNISFSPETVHGKTLIMDSGWSRIASTTTMPFKFQPTFMARYVLTGCNNDTAGAITWSRDRANPILYVMDTEYDHIWAIKPGRPATRINTGPNLDSIQKSLITSADGARLIRGDRITKQLHFFDITSPSDSVINGGVVALPASGYMSQVATITLSTSQPRALAALPFNTIKSTPASGRFECIATLSKNLSGIHLAAVASGGVYIMGGSPTEQGPAPGTAITGGGPTDSIFRFDPSVATITPLVATLSKAIKQHSIAAYDNKVYVFNGNINTTGGTNSTPTDWVQMYDPETGKVISSFDPPVSGTLTELQVSFNQSTLPSPTTVSHTGTVYSTFTGLKAFDGNKTTYGNQWSPSTANQIVTYDVGNSYLKFPVNKIKISNYDSNANIDALHAFEFYGDANLLLSGTTAGYNTTEEFNVPSSTAYQTYKLKAVSKKDGGSGPGFTLSELELFLSGVRKVPSYDMTNYSAPGPDSVTSSGDISGERAWQAFDSDPASSRWTCNNNANQHITLTLDTPDILDIVSIRCNTTGRVNNFKIQAANQADFSDSVDLKIGGPTGTTVGVHQNTTSRYLYFLDNSTAYKHYRLFVQSVHSDSDIEVSDLRFYSTVPPSTAVNGPSMTKVMTDTSATVAVQEGAACTTPYGIVVAGGKPTGNATATAMVYWPHAYESFDPGNPPLPTLWYKLDETSGTVAKNFAGATDGTVVSPTWVPGKINNALQLNGTSTRISAPRPVQDDFTIACWIKTSAVGDGTNHWQTASIVHAEGAGVNDDFCFGIDSAGKLTYGDGKTSGSDIVFRTASAINNNTWRHVAVTRTKSTGAVKLYVDGVMSISNTCNVGNALNAAATIEIGHAPYAPTNKFLNGMIDDIRIYNQALSDDHIKRIMTGDLCNFGIFRSITNMPGGRYGHCLVWHKGKMYRIGGKDHTNTVMTSVDIFDFDNNAWGAPPLTSTTYFTGSTNELARFKAAACSFGDEIFVFGGEGKTNVIAWNPETTVVRVVATMPNTANYARSAVAWGSAIYLIGGSTSASAGATASIWKFTP